MENSIKKIFLSADGPAFDGLRSALATPNSLNENAFQDRGWNAAYLEDANFITFDVISLIRYCRKTSVKSFYAVDTFDLLSNQESIPVRKFNADLDGLNKGLWGLSPKNREHPNFNWFLRVSVQVSFIVPEVHQPEFLIFRDAGGCTTILGPDVFVRFIVGRSRRTWWSGIPARGVSLAYMRRPFVLNSRGKMAP